MKRILFLCHCLAGFWLATQAANIITVTGGAGHPGDELTVTVAMSGADAVTALEVQLPLGEWLELVDGSCSLNGERSDGHLVTAASLSPDPSPVGRGEVLRIYAYSLGLRAFKGTDGEILSFRLRLGEAPGDFVLAPTVLASNAAGTTVATTATAGTVTILCPALRVVTERLDFGRVPIRSSYERSLVLENYGNEPLTITGITSSDSEASPPSPLHAERGVITIAPGSTESVKITYSPLKRTTLDATLMIESDAVNAKIYNRWQTARVVAAPFSVNELHVTGAQGASDTEVEIALRMNNMEPIVGGQVSFRLPEALKYVEGSAAMTGRSDGHTITASLSPLPTGAGERLTLFFFSSSNKALKDDDGDICTFRLSLEGQSGWYRLSPEDVILSNAAMENMTSATSGGYAQIQSPTISGSATLSFGQQDATKPLTATYSIHNSGQATLTVEKVTFLADGFRVVTPLPMTVATGQSAGIQLEYTAANAGDFSTTMNVYSNDPATRVKGVSISGTAFSPNELAISGTRTGSDCQLSIGLANDSPLTAVQFDVAIGHATEAQGTAGSPDIIPSARLKSHNASIYDMGNGTWKVLVFSMTNAEIASGEGEICSIHFPATAPQGDVTFTLSNVILSSKDGRNMLSPVPTQPQSCTLEAPGTLLGDVNGDGKVDSQDVFIVTNMVLNTATSGDRNAADMNGDGSMDSQDVYMIINKVLGR